MKKNYHNTKVKKLLLIFPFFLIFTFSNTSCFILKRGPVDHQVEAEKEEASKNRKILREYKKGVKKYQKEFAGGEGEILYDEKIKTGKQVYKRMKKNKRIAARINNNKPREPWYIRMFKKDRIKDPFYKRWARRIEYKWEKITKKKS